MVEIYRVKNEQEMEFVRKIRREVFIVEQGISQELETDGLDNVAIHVLAYMDGVPAGCGRLLLKGKEAKIGRVAVKKDFRRYGIGTGICKLLIALAGDNGAERVYLFSQLSAVEFYTSIGFKKEGEIFIEAGIEHIKMIREI